MKYIRQFGIILAVTCAGEILHVILPLPIPASIYGLVLMFILLATKRLPLAAVQETAQFLIDIMPLLFIPAVVGLLEAWPLLQPMLLPVCVIMLVSTVLVMVVTGRFTQHLRQKQQKEDAANADMDC